MTSQSDSASIQWSVARFGGVPSHAYHHRPKDVAPMPDTARNSRRHQPLTDALDPRAVVSLLIPGLSVTPRRVEVQVKGHETSTAAISGITDGPAPVRAVQPGL